MNDRVAKDTKGMGSTLLGNVSKDNVPSTHQGHISNISSNLDLYYVPLISKAFYVQDDEVVWLCGGLT